jgi:glyoxylase-like metal-dependent hydrolase (beta-lactamase superfamily II)
MYVILGDDKCILIDSGCGTGDYRDFVTNRINKARLPYLVISTHVHFDHIGANHRFCGAHKEGCLDVCMGCENKTFSQNVEINSLAMAHSHQVKPFTVSRWLNEGELIYLNDAKPSRELSLEVIFTPGHTPDSIALYAHWEKRLFVGDIIYPFTTIHVDGIGSNAADYLNSLKKISKFIDTQESANPTPSPTPPTTTSTNTSSSPTPPTQRLNDVQKATIEEFYSILNLDEATRQTFSAESLMSFCDWDVTSAIDFYLGNASEIFAICPPTPSSQASSQQIQQNLYQGGNKVVLSCGHVECNLESSNVKDVVTFLEMVKQGFVEPSSIDSDYGDFNNGTFSIMLPLKPKWNMYTKPPV